MLGSHPAYTASSSALMAIELEMSADALYHEAGIQPDDAEGGEAVTRAALEADPLLTPRQRRALLEVYDSFVAVNGRRAAPRGKRRQG